MRIASSMLYSSSVQTMDNQQSQLLELEQEISSGTAFTTPAENPVGAAEAVQLSSTNATLGQYSTNQSDALTSLQLEYSTLTSVTGTLQSVNSLMEEAADGTLSDSDRSSIAQQLTSDRSQLLDLANTTDGSGNYIFSGFTSTSQVFTNAAGGGVVYNGDSGQRVMQVSGTANIAVADTGAAVFMTVPSVGTSPVPAGSASNTGTGTIGAVTVTDSTASTNGDTFSISFSDDANGDPQYTVTDTTSGTVLASDQAYTSGSAIDLGTGMNVAISGTPAAGDTFSVTPANSSANSDVFATIDNVISALQASSTSNDATASATLTNALTTGMTALGNSLTNVTTVQASVGGRSQEVEALQTVTSSNTLQTQTTLSDLTSTNMTATISQYEEVMDALTASQKSFASTQGLSLFQYINP